MVTAHCVQSQHYCITNHRDLRRTSWSMGQIHQFLCPQLWEYLKKHDWDPAEYMLTLSTNMGQLLITARERYQIYIRRTADTYITPSPLGTEEPLGMRIWCWSPYWKRGTSGALSAKWSGPWKIVQFKPPALTLLQSEWLHLKGKPEVQREAVIDKIRPYLDTKEI